MANNWLLNWLKSIYELNSDATDAHWWFDWTPTSLTYVSWKINNAWDFNWSSSKVSIPNMWFNSAWVSMCAWVNPDVTTYTDDWKIIDFGNWTNYLLLFQNSSWLACNWNFWWTPSESAKYSISTWTWYHIWVTFKAWTMKFYVNGSLYDTVTWIWTTDWTSTFGMIGQEWNDANPRYFNGQIEQWLLYWRELSAYDMSNLWNSWNWLDFSEFDSVSYRKQVTITWQTNAWNNYQVLLSIWESASSSSADFHVESNASLFASDKWVSWDLNFKDSSWASYLPFWVESVSWTAPNRTAKVWVKVSEDLWTNKDIYCYYWDSNNNNLNDWDLTFDFFDDFDWASLDTSKWTVWSWSIATSWSEATTWASASPSDNANTSWKASITTLANRWFRMRWRIRRDSWSDTYFSAWQNSTDRIQMWNTSYFSKWFYTFWSWVYSLSQTWHWNNANWDYIYDLKCVSTTLNYYQESWLSWSRTLATTVNSKTFYFTIGWWDSFYPMDYLNFIAVWKYIATEPAFNTAWPQEEASKFNNTWAFFNFFN